MKKFLIVTEKGWSPGDEDIIQMHKLCHDLNMCGAKAYITHKRGNPLLKTPFLNELENTIDCKDFTKNKKLGKRFFKDYYVVYPEHITPEIFNNDTIHNVYAFQYFKKHSKLLKINKFNNFKKTFSFNLTSYFNFLPAMYGSKFYHNLPSLHIQYIDFDTFKNLNKKRKGQAYIQKKGLIKIHKHSKEALFLEPYLHDWALMSQILNSIEILYCYDVRSIWPVLAALCGCKVIVVPNILSDYENIQSIDYRNISDLYKYGIAFNDSAQELEHATKTLHLVYDNAVNFCINTSINNAKTLIHQISNVA